MINKTLFERLSKKTDMARKRKSRKARYFLVVTDDNDAKALEQKGLDFVCLSTKDEWMSDYNICFAGLEVFFLPTDDDDSVAFCEGVWKSICDIVPFCAVFYRDQMDLDDSLAFLNNRRQDMIPDTKGHRLDKYASHCAYWLEFDTRQINNDDLAQVIAENLHYYIVPQRILKDNDIFLYKEGVYRKSSETEFCAEIKKFIPQGLCKGAGMLNCLKALLMADSSKIKLLSEFDAEENLINFENGIYDVAEDKLYPHSPKWLCTLQIQGMFGKQSSKAEGLFFDYINDLCRNEMGVVDNEVKMVLQEWMGLIISNFPISALKKCLYLVSKAHDTGKSSFSNLIEGLLGASQVSSVRLNDFNERYSMGSIFGHRLNVCPDCKKIRSDDMSTLKVLTGNDRIDVEYKYRQSFSGKFTGGIIICGNELPAFTGEDAEVVLSRIIFIPLFNAVSEFEKKPGIEKELLKEKNNIIAWAIEGLKRLINNNMRFSSCKASEFITEQCLEHSRQLNPLNLIDEFISEQCITGCELSKNRISKTDFASRFIDWTADKYDCTFTTNKVHEMMQEKGYPKGKVAGEWYWKGICWKDSNPEDDTAPDNQP